MAKKRKTRAEVLSEKAKRDADYETARQLQQAEEFGRAVRREHEALGKLLIMLDHITGMPTVPEVISEARAAFADIRLRTVQISAPAGAVIGATRWMPR